MAYSEWKNAGSQVYYLGTGTSFNIAQILPNDYQNLTADNFIIQSKTLGCSVVAANGAFNYKSGSASVNVSKNYNNSTGQLTISNTSVNKRIEQDPGRSDTAFATATATLGNIQVYCVIGDIETAS